MYGEYFASNCAKSRDHQCNHVTNPSILSGDKMSCWYYYKRSNSATVAPKNNTPLANICYKDWLLCNDIMAFQANGEKTCMTYRLSHTT